jgi:phosphohistidine phosphatase
MKKLYIVRHAKSAWDSGVEDFNRPLKTKGKLAAPFMAEKLVSRGIHPNLIISSSAKRTKQTTELISKKMGIENTKIQFTKDLYLASPKTIISIIQAVSDDVNELMIVAHNPGVTQVINYLATEHFENVPTSGIACILCPIDSWSELKNNGKLGFYLYPKMFKTNFGN